MSLIKKITLFIFSTGILGLICVLGVIFYFSANLPQINSLADYQPSTPTQILSKDGVILAELGVEKREVVPFEQIPQRIVDAFLSAEDSNFYEHTGVDYLGVARAMLANLKAGRVVQGGSTITQQVAKSFLLTRERSITRKIKDFLLAQKIEKRFSKKEILYLYLNQVYLGGGYYGVKTAFEGYFNKELDEATNAEAAMVAGLLVAPGRYSPYINPKRARIRQGYVLKRMLANNKITESEYQTALDEKTKFYLRDSGRFKAGYFTDWVRQEILALVGEKVFLNGGLKIETTLDWKLQETAEKEVKKGLREVDKRQGFNKVIKTLSEPEIVEYIKKQRLAFFKNKSNFFTINADMKKEYEYIFKPETIDTIISNMTSFEGIKNGIRPGYVTTDELLNVFNTKEYYEAVVTGVNDKAGLIFVNLGGVSGAIPKSGFSWAHKRKLSEKYLVFREQTRPSNILKRGDVITVKVSKKKANLNLLTGSSYRSRLKKLSSEVKDQSYLKCSLEQEPEVEGALVSMNPENGEIISMVGGFDFKKSQFNRAVQAERQPGSSFKPFLFAAGLEENYTPGTIIMDSPEALGGVDETLNWKPKNYDNKFKGPVTFRNSLEQSRNIPTLKIAYQIGVSKMLNFVDRIGFKANLPSDLSYSLGSFGVKLVDIVASYSIFPNGGKRIRPKAIISVRDKNGNLIPLDKKAEDLETTNQETKVTNKPLQRSLNKKQVYDKRLAYIMTNILKGVVRYGTGQSTKGVSPYLGGKTGTTNDYFDAWFIGFSSNVVTGVWTGFDDNKTLGYGETGAKSALPAWRGFMRRAVEKHGKSDFAGPPGVVHVGINKETGRLALPGEDPFIEIFVKGTEPGNENLEEMTEEDQKGQVYNEDDYYDNI